MARSSDRWATPAVIIWGMAFATLILCVIVAAVAFLTWQGFDPAPVVQLVANLVAALTGTGVLGLQLAQRATTTRVERKVGRLVPGEDPEPPTSPVYGRPGARPRRPQGS